jgi:RNA polymerase sigma-70 factor (ECF subfamily)
MTTDIREELVGLLPRLRRFAVGLVGNLEDADDLVQSACERALAKTSQWQPGTRLDSWMYRIIQNLWIDRGRSHRVRGDSVDLDQVPDLADSSAHRIAEIDSTLARVSQALGELSPDQREVLLLVGVGEHSYREAAEQLGVPVGTVMSRLARARLRLQELVDGGATAPRDGG